MNTVQKLAAACEKANKARKVFESVRGTDLEKPALFGFFAALVAQRWARESLKQADLLRAAN